MQEDLTKHPKISEFLHLYPKSDWKSCLTSILIIGINTLEATFKKFLPLEELEYLSDSTPLPLRLQIPDLKQTLSTMKETIDKINNSLEKEDPKQSTRKSMTRKIPRPKKFVPNPILVESTPRFKVLDDAFNKQKWKKDLSMQTIKEESGKPLIGNKSRPKSTLKSSSVNKRVQKLGPTTGSGGKGMDKNLKLPVEGGFTERNYAGSPTLEELLSNSRFTVREEGRSGRGETLLANSDLKHSFERSLRGKELKNSALDGQKECAVSIAEGFLKNPLISQLAFKRRSLGDEADGKATARSCSPINSLDVHREY